MKQTKKIHDYTDSESDDAPEYIEAMKIIQKMKKHMGIL